MKKLTALLLALMTVCLLLSGCSEKELSDGRYTIEAKLNGGTGRATIESPVDVIIENETVTATIVWSSPFYEYMLVDGVQYEPVQETGNATFHIPVTLDKDMEVSASTIAMSQPYLIDYTLHFDSGTLEGAEK